MEEIRIIHRDIVTCSLQPGACRFAAVFCRKKNNGTWPDFILPAGLAVQVILQNPGHIHAGAKAPRHQGHGPWIQFEQHRLPAAGRQDEVDSTKSR